MKHRVSKLLSYACRRELYLDGHLHEENDGKKVVGNVQKLSFLSTKYNNNTS